MADVIQCPTCSKRYKLPERPPATFTCSACNTVMDLSAFREAAAAAAPAAAPASAPSTSGSRTAGSRAPRSKSARPGAAAARARHARAAREGDDDEEGGGRGLPPPKKNNSILIGSLIGFVVVIGIAIVVIGNKNRAKDSDVAAAKKRETDKKAAEMAALAAEAAKAAAAMAEPVKDPAIAAAEAAAAAKKASAKGGLHPIDFTADASEADRKKIDDLVQKAVFENNGSDSLAAGRELVAMGLKAAPRLINVFYTVKIGEGFDSREGKTKASVADSLLRKIDGYMERKRRITQQIKATSDPKWAESTAKTWTGWWDTEAYKKPEKPYDPRYDDNPDSPAMTDSGMVVGDGAMSGDGTTPEAPHDGK